MTPPETISSIKKNGHVHILELLFENYTRMIDFEKENKNQMNPLNFAARYGVQNGEAVWKCIESLYTKLNMKIGEDDAYSFTFLHHAIQNGKMTTFMSSRN